MGTEGVTRSRAVRSGSRRAGLAPCLALLSLALFTGKLVSADCGQRPYLEPIRYPAGTWPFAPVAVDLEGDADLDLVVSNRYTKFLSALVNDGVGRFDQRIQVPLPHDAGTMTSVDLDGDGDTDFIASSSESYSYILAVENLGGGLFEAKWSVPIGLEAPNQLVTGDLDGDDDTDVVYTTGGLTTLLQEDDGTFTSAFSTGSPYAIGDVTAGDFDDDGDLDVAGAAAEVILFRNVGQGRFEGASVSPLWFGPGSITSMDFDTDGDRDLAMVTEEYIRILVNDGSGGFTPASPVGFRHRGGSILAHDLDGDGRQDFAVALGLADAIAVFVQVVPGVFSELPILPNRGFPSNLVAGDFDRDGDADLASANKDSDDIVLLRSTIMTTQIDCNANGNPDECDIALFVEPDCNSNGIPDTCDLDCDGDGVPDDCALLEAPSLDCNLNAVPDLCDLSAGTARDCNGNAVPDECEDCNANRLPDPCELHGRLLADCGANSIPDPCEPDCNENGQPDDCDLRAGTSNDVNDNGLPDECEASLRLELGFRAPPWVSMSPGLQGRATAFVELETTGPRGEWPAIYGWNLRVRSSGCRMAEASVGSTAGDARALGGSRFAGFHWEELVSVEGEEESILTAIMVLSFIDASALPRGRSRHDLLKLDLTRDSLPGSACGECTLEFEDVPGSPPVVNQITMDRSARLDFEALRIRFCPMESCEGAVSDLCRRQPFHRGDGNDSGRLDISDALFILAFVFDRGRAPPCTEAADTNDDGELDISDGILILNHLFLAQGAPAPPGPPPAPCDWDGDPFGSEKDLGCTSYTSC